MISSSPPPQFGQVHVDVEHALEHPRPAEQRTQVRYHSIPYGSITHFNIKTAGTFDLDAELKIWISSNSVPLQKTFNKMLSIYEVQAVLAS